MALLHSFFSNLPQEWLDGTHLIIKHLRPVTSVAVLRIAFRIIGPLLPRLVNAHALFVRYASHSLSSSRLPFFSPYFSSGIQQCILPPFIFMFLCSELKTLATLSYSKPYCTNLSVSIQDTNAKILITISYSLIWVT